MWKISKTWDISKHATYQWLLWNIQRCRDHRCRHHAFNEFLCLNSQYLHNIITTHRRLVHVYDKCISESTVRFTVSSNQQCRHCCSIASSYLCLTSIDALIHVTLSFVNNANFYFPSNLLAVKHSDQSIGPIKACYVRDPLVDMFIMCA